MNETPEATQSTAPKKHPLLLALSYGFSVIPLAVWIVWPWTFGDTSSEAYRTTFGILIGLPFIALVCSVFGVLLFKKSVKLAFLPALFLALLAALLCYFIASSTVDP